MEGKALLFKEFAGRRRVPDLPRHGDVTSVQERSTRSSRRSSASRPCSAASTSRTSPRRACFEVEERLRDLLDIPVFHDDQHGTAVVTLAALENALRDRRQEDGRPHGRDRRRRRGRRRDRQDPDERRRDATSSASTARARSTRAATTSTEVKARSPRTPTPSRSGRAAEVMPGADVFIGVSGPDLITADDLRMMAHGPDRVRHGQPRPRDPARGREGLAAVMATGRSDYPNQINNVLAFPGIFRGALDAGATDDHRAHEAGGGRRPSPRRCPTTSCAPTSSCRRCSTRPSSSWSPPRSPKPR